MVARCPLTGRFVFSRPGHDELRDVSEDTQELLRSELPTHRYSVVYREDVESVSGWRKYRMGVVDLYRGLDVNVVHFGCASANEVGSLQNVTTLARGFDFDEKLRLIDRMAPAPVALWWPALTIGVKNDILQEIETYQGHARLDISHLDGQVCTLTRLATFPYCNRGTRVCTCCSGSHAHVRIARVYGLCDMGEGADWNDWQAHCHRLQLI